MISLKVEQKLRDDVQPPKGTVIFWVFENHEIEPSIPLVGNWMLLIFTGGERVILVKQLEHESIDGKMRN